MTFSDEHQQALQEFRQLVAGERSLIVRHQGGWQVLASYGFPEQVEVETQLCPQVLDWCWRSGESLLSEDIDADERFRSNSTLLTGIRSVLCVPLKGPDNRCRLLLYTDYRGLQARFTYTDLLNVQQWVARHGQPARTGVKRAPAQVVRAAPPASVPQITMKTDEWRSFYRMLATFLTSGISLTRGLAGLEGVPDSQAVSRVAERSRVALQQGLPLSQALAGAVHLPRQHRSLLKLAENSGSLDLVLSRLADHMERVSAAQRKLGAALVYPLFLLAGGALLAVAGPIWLLRPQLEMLASQGQQLPWLTQCLLWLGRSLSWFPTWVALAVVGVTFFRKLPEFWARADVQRRALSLAGLGRLLRKRAEYETATSLALSLEVGIPLLEALSSSLESASCVLLRQELPRFCECLKQGETLAEAFRQSEVISQQFSCLVEVGEESGKLPQVMKWVAKMAELDLELAQAALVALLEPVLLLLGGAVVGTIVIATMLPSLKLVESL